MQDPTAFKHVATIAASKTKKKARRPLICRLGLRRLAYKNVFKLMKKKKAAHMITFADGGNVWTEMRVQILQFNCCHQQCTTLQFM